MPIRARSYMGRRLISAPQNTTRPAVGRTEPAMMLNNVDLPAPFGPMMPHTSPRWMTSETSRSAVTPPNAIETASSASRGSSEDMAISSILAPPGEVMESAAETRWREQGDENHQNADAENRLAGRKAEKLRHQA